VKLRSSLPRSPKFPLDIPAGNLWGLRLEQIDNLGPCHIRRGDQHFPPPGSCQSLTRRQRWFAVQRFRGVVEDSFIVN
jgi:hypothetical protein